MAYTSAPRLTRLNKYLADCGLASRRNADKLIADGHVTINGKKVFELGIKVDPKRDRVLVTGKPVREQRQRHVMAFHKPRGVLTTMEDPLNRPTIKDYFEHFSERLFPVGRLDWDSEGLLLVTNDGDLAHQITHPKHEITKTYLVKVDGQPKPEQLDKLRRGVSIIGGKAKASHVTRIKRPEGSDQYAWLKIIITEGRNRQIRMMFEKIGFDVLKLQRVAIGRLKLGRLDRGEFTMLDDADIQKIFLADDPEELVRKKSYAGRVAPAAKADADTASTFSRSPRSSRSARTATAPSRTGNAPRANARGAKRTGEEKVAKDARAPRTWKKSRGAGRTKKSASTQTTNFKFE